MKKEQKEETKKSAGEIIKKARPIAGRIEYAED
jgi:hypothetical protein